MDDDLKEALDDIIRPLAMICIFVYLALVFRPCFLFSADLLWVFVTDDVFFMGWWIVLLLWFCVIIVAVWMFFMFKIGLWE